MTDGQVKPTDEGADHVPDIDTATVSDEVEDDAEDTTPVAGRITEGGPDQPSDLWQGDIQKLRALDRGLGREQRQAKVEQDLPVPSALAERGSDRVSDSDIDAISDEELRRAARRLVRLPTPTDEEDRDDTGKK